MQETQSTEKAAENQEVNSDDPAQDSIQTEAVANGKPGALDLALDQAKEAERKYLYLSAEFDNYRKRMQRERADFLKYGHEGFLRDQLQILDNFQRALDHAKAQKPEPQSAFGQVVLGVEMIHNQFLESLKNQGVTEVKAAGLKFDPLLHEAVGEEESEVAEANTILKEFQKGYLLHGRLLRAAKVVVAKEILKDANSESSGE